MKFNLFGGNDKKALNSPSYSAPAEPTKSLSEVLSLLSADASSIKEFDAKYAAFLAEYNKVDLRKLKQYPTYKDYTQSQNKEILTSGLQILKGKESCVEHSLKLHTKYSKELAHAKLPRDIPTPAKLIRMKDEISEARAFINEEISKLDNIESNAAQP